MPIPSVIKIPSRVKDISSGETFGRLTVISFSHVDSCGDAYWKCTCSCGETSIRKGSSLRRGHVKSCGCWYKEKSLKHGHSKGGVRSSEYTCWKSLRSRCLNKNDRGYSRYGGRGITVCKRWRDSFEAFLEDMGLKPSPKHSIDRINNNKGYSKSNCRWALLVTQARNRRSNRKLKFRGESLCIIEWAERLGCRYQRIVSRLHRGWSIEKALTCPSLRPGRPKGSNG